MPVCIGYSLFIIMIIKRRNNKADLISKESCIAKEEGINKRCST